MFQTIKRFDYKAFGLYIHSEIELPELLPTIESPQTNDTPVRIEKGDLVQLWNESAEASKAFYIKDQSVLFRIEKTAIFLIENGKKIIVSPLDGFDKDKIRLYILGTCMGALLLQRKILPLHGSALEIDGKAIVIVGERGAGKSTLASALIQKGFYLLSDDVVPVTFNNTNIPMVEPAYPQQKLWQESLNAFGMDSETFNPLFERETKYAVPVNNSFYSEVLPLAGVFELVKKEGDQTDIYAIKGLERFPLLYSNTFRSFLVPKLGLTEWHFKYLSRFINKIYIYRMIRPSSSFTANELSEQILNTVRGK